MKKMIGCTLAVLCSLSVLACGCFNKEKINDTEEVRQTIDRPFSSTADIRYGSLSAKANILNESSGFEIELTEPKTLEGMYFGVQDKMITIKYKGIEKEMSIDEFYSSSIVKIIISSINKATSDDGLELEMGESTITITGVSDSGKFTLLIDKDEGSYLNLSIPDANFSMDFKNFSFSN